MTAQLDQVSTAIGAWFDQHADQAVATAQELIRIPSVNPKFDQMITPGAERQVQEVIAAHMEAVGRESTTYDVTPGRTNLHTVMGSSHERSLVFNGHIDVVPVGDEKQWTQDPFGGQLVDGKVYGRGAMDMKGGIACAITAIEALSEVGVELGGALGLQTVVDEEAGGFGTRSLLERIGAPTAVVVNEPTGEELQIAEGGLEWVRVVIRGRNNHSAWRYGDIYPQPAGEQTMVGVNAITLVAEFVKAIERLEHHWAMTKRHPLLPVGFTTISPGVLRAGSSISEENLPSLYDNPAMVPDVAAIDFDIKFFPGEENRVRGEFEEFVWRWASQYPWLEENPPEIHWELKDLRFPSMDTSPEDPVVKAVETSATAVTGSALITGFPAVADSAFYSAAGSSALIYGPIGGGLHAPDEWVDAESLKTVSRVLALSAVQYLGVR